MQKLSKININDINIDDSSICAQALIAAPMLVQQVAVESNINQHTITSKSTKKEFIKINYI